MSRVRLFSSLTNRIFLASALLAVLAIGFAIWLVNVRITREAEEELTRGLIEAGGLVEQHRATALENAALVARLVADLPKLKAAAETADPPTVQPLAADYHARVGSDVFAVADRRGRLLASAGVALEGHAPPVAAALAGRETVSFGPHARGVLQVVTVPISIGAEPPEILGALSVGFVLDEALARRFEDLTHSEVAFVLDGVVRASTLAEADGRALAGLAGARGVREVEIGGTEYVALARPLGPAGGPGPVVLVLRSRTERLQGLRQLHAALLVTALVAVLGATLLGYAVARTITRPLAAITAAMREVAATGDLSRRAPVPAGGWSDEDARLLATTFNALTDALARFQREAGLRERLSALGRLSTVIAHEIRNPLMIIKASLRTMRREDALEQERREAAADIEEEVARLNRIVNEVLDYARPLRPDYEPVDLAALLRGTAAALPGEGPVVALSLEPGLGTVVTDGERVRTALLNVLANARQAVAAGGGGGEAPPIELRAQAADGRVAIEVADQGTGIAAEDLPHVFEPYFTTKRGGTGLGLAIAKNIVEGLGGSISVKSRPREGTRVRIELPAAPRT